MGGRRPQQTRAGLVLPTGKDVALELRPHRQPDFILKDRDLVFHERAVNIVCHVMGHKVHGSDRLDDATGTPSSAQPPDNFISSLQDQMVDEVKVEGVACFSSCGPSR